MPQTSPNKFKDPKRGAETKIALTISGGQCHHYKNATGSFTALGIIPGMRRIRACFGTSEVPIVFFGIPRTFSICFAIFVFDLKFLKLKIQELIFKILASIDF